MRCRAARRTCRPARPAIPLGAQTSAGPDNRSPVLRTERGRHPPAEPLPRCHSGRRRVRGTDPAGRIGTRPDVDAAGRALRHGGQG